MYTKKHKVFSEVLTLDKKMINMILAGIGVGFVLLILYQSLSGSFTSGKVYFEPQGKMDVQGDVSATAQNYNALGFRIIKANSDMCISPNMLASNIGLYAEGAVDDGRDQAEMMLGYADNLKENHAALVNALSVPSGDAFFSGLFMDKNTKPKEQFVEANQYYGTYFETLDFYDFEAVKDNINNMVAGKTGGKINQVINKIYAKSSMIFVSALNIKENFSSDVGNINIANKEFMGNQTEYYEIDKAKVFLYEDDSVIFLKLPLENGYDYEMIMSKSGDLSSMTLADIKGYRDSAKEVIAAVSMPSPKFSGYYELKEPLKAVGFDAPFNKTTIITNLTESIKVKVDKMDQSISYEITQKEVAREIDGEISQTVVIDKPYYYMVSDRNTGCKTIMGKKSS